MGPDGSLTGAPSKVGTSTAKILFTDSVTGDREVKTLTITIADKAPVKVAETVPAKVGSSLDPLARIVSRNPVTTSLVSGDLPPGVTLNPDGSFEGKPTTKGSFEATIMVTDSVTGDRELRTITFDVAESDVVSKTVTRTLLLGEDPKDLDPINPGNPITARVVNGALPSGVTMTPAGVLSGAPDRPGSSIATVSITDTVTGERENRTVVFTVTERPAAETTESKAADVGGSFAPLAPINPGKAIQTSLVSGSLPEGVSLNRDGTLSGSPTEAGTHTVVIMVTDPDTFERELRTVTMAVEAPEPKATSERIAAKVGERMGALAPVNAGNDITAEIVDGTLPKGVTLGKDGTFEGAPSEAGTHTVTVLVTDQKTGEQERRSITIEVTKEASDNVDEDVKRTSETLSTSERDSFAPISAMRSGNSITVNGAGALAFTGANSTTLALLGGALVVSGGVVVRQLLGPLDQVMASHPFGEVEGRLCQHQEAGPGFGRLEERAFERASAQVHVRVVVGPGLAQVGWHARRERKGMAEPLRM